MSVKVGVNESLNMLEILATNDGPTFASDQKHIAEYLSFTGNSAVQSNNLDQEEKITFTMSGYSSHHMAILIENLAEKLRENKGKLTELVLDDKSAPDSREKFSSAQLLEIKKAVEKMPTGITLTFGENLKNLVGMDSESLKKADTKALQAGARASNIIGHILGAFNDVKAHQDKTRADEFIGKLDESTVKKLTNIDRIVIHNMVKLSQTEESLSELADIIKSNKQNGKSALIEENVESIKAKSQSEGISGNFKKAGSHVGMVEKRIVSPSL